MGRKERRETPTGMGIEQTWIVVYRVPGREPNVVGGPNSHVSYWYGGKEPQAGAEHIQKRDWTVVLLDSVTLEGLD